VIVRNVGQSALTYSNVDRWRHGIDQSVKKMKTGRKRWNVIFWVLWSYTSKKSTVIVLTVGPELVLRRDREKCWSGLKAVVTIVTIRLRYGYNTTTSLRHYDFATSVARVSCDTRAIKWQWILILLLILSL